MQCAQQAFGHVARCTVRLDFRQVDEQGRIQVDCFNKTRTPGLFAAGDVTTICSEQVLVAVGEGAKAALSAYDYLLPLL